MTMPSLESDQLDHIDSLKLKLEALCEQNMYMHNILLNLPEQFYWLDLEGRVVMCNERQASYFGMTREEFIGITIYDLAERLGWGREVADQVRQNDLDVMATGQRLMKEEEFEFNGERKTFLSYKYPLYDTHQVLIGIFGLSIDITDRKNMEIELLEQKRKAELANVAKNNFLMNISHDIRTPFSGIIGNSEILIKQETSEEKKERLKEILTSSQYLLELLDDIIDVVKLEEKHKPVPASFDLIQSVERMATLMRQESKHKGLEFKVSVADNVPRTVLSDRKSIERILLNLLGNAIKFTDKGWVSLSLKCISQNEQQACIELNVSDTGVGIAKDKIDTVFERFARLNSNFDHSFQGSGLGLWIVKGLVEQLGGHITVKSELNQGTQFTIRLTLSLSNTSNTNKIESKVQDKHTVILQSILVIEDNPIAQKAAHYMLSDFFKADVDTASSAEEAIILTQKKIYDLILMDLELPDMPGHLLATKIKQDTDHQKHTPIIALSAYSDIKADPDTFISAISKPLTYQNCKKIADILKSRVASVRTNLIDNVGSD